LLFFIYLGFIVSTGLTVHVLGTLYCVWMTVFIRHHRRPRKNPAFTAMTEELILVMGIMMMMHSSLRAFLTSKLH